MKVYIEVQINASDPKHPFPYFHRHRDDALIALRHDSRIHDQSDWSLHELDFDPVAGFQTVSITQLSPDGTRHDEEHRREQAELTRQFNTAHPIT